MKKTALTLILITLISGVLKAQNRATTWEEYNYLNSGQFNLVLPGHRLVQSNITASISFMDAVRTVEIWELYRDGSTAPCAVLINYKKSNIRQMCLAVPE